MRMNIANKRCLCDTLHSLLLLLAQLPDVLLLLLLLQHSACWPHCTAVAMHSITQRTPKCLLPTQAPQDTQLTSTLLMSNHTTHGHSHLASYLCMHKDS
jgi:hypothetical protein